MIVRDGPSVLYGERKCHPGVLVVTPPGPCPDTWLPTRVQADSGAMSDESKRVDAYIAQAAPFARSILERIRLAFHEGCPDIQERIKWGVPSFEKDGIVGGMAAFKVHASFGFWRAAELEEARRPETRLRRLEKTIEWLSEGKTRNWKYTR